VDLPLAERIRGCLLGGACGDALGAPVEFLSTRQIAARFGSKGITGFEPDNGPLGAVTDDTQMTMFTVEGLIRARVRQELGGVSDWPAVVHRACLRWLSTQLHPHTARPSIDGLDGWLIEDARLWSQRAPGTTCLVALKSATTLGAPAENDSKGCGTVMRDAPWGLAFPGDPDTAFRLAFEAARTTHGHPSAHYASGAIAAIVSRLCAGLDLGDAVERTITGNLRHPDGVEVAAALVMALQFAGQPGWRSSLLELGGGWVAEEALAIAVLCALSAEGSQQALIAAVNHDGDSDSTGAICGNLLGAALGADAFPAEWIAQLEMRDLLETLASDLADSLMPGFDARAFEVRYPGW
jgi:ADP-ribosylglycohydrolase